MTRTRVISVAASVALAVGVLAAATPAEAAVPAAPTGLTPTGPVSSTTPTLTWKKVTGATAYVVQIDDSASFDSPSYNMTTVNNRAVPTTSLPDGTVHWRVRATNSSGASSWSSADLEISPTAAPTPVSPIDGQQLAQPNDPPLLTWAATAGVVGYNIQVAADDTFTTNLTTYTSAGTSFVVPTPQTAGDWYWRVQANRGGGLTTAWSDAAHFVVEALPDVEADPDMNSGQPMQDVVLDWLPVPGATKYEIVVGLDPDFNNLIEGSKGTTHKYVYGTRYSPPTTYDNDQYYWEVRAINAAGTASEWPVTPWIFQREWPERPQLLHPAQSTTVGDAFYFQWTPVNSDDGTVLRHATEYQLNVSTDPNFSPGSFSTCTTASTTYAAGYGANDPCMPPIGLNSYWRVRAIDQPAGVEGIYSAVHSFTYSPESPDMLSPVSETVDVPTLMWAAARDTQKYYVEVRNNNGAKIASATTRALSWTPDKVLDPANGPFTWWLRTIDADGNSSPLHGAAFQVTGIQPSTGADALTPLTGISGDTPTSRFPSLSWEPAATATSYRVWIRQHSTNGTPNAWLDPNVSTITKTSYEYSAATDTEAYFLTPGGYDWMVQAFNDSTSLGFGTIDTFTIVDLADVAGQKIALSGSALDGPAAASCPAALGVVVSEEDICTGVPTTPVLDWDPVPDAAGYMVYLANDRALTNRIFTAAITTNSRWTPTRSMVTSALADNTALDSYYWYIRPCKSVTNPIICNVDPVSTNQAATNAFRKIAPPVDLVSPVNNGDVTAGTNEVTFTWRDYLDSNRENIYPINADGELSMSEARSYKLVVSQSPTMSPLLSGFPVTVDQTTYTPYDKTLPEGTLYWRVQAVDAEGNSLNWSPTWSFTKASPAVSLVSPVNGVGTSGATPFRWQAAPGAASYTLEVYKNNDSLFQSANRVLSVTGIKQTAYQYSKYLPSSTSDYLWRVRYVDAGGKPGPWTRQAGEPASSPDGRFSVHAAAVTLGYPGSGAYQPGAAPYFTWQPVANAATYYLEVRLVGSASPTIKQVTAAQAFAVTSTTKDGAYEWRVTARDPNAGSLAQSVGWRPFKIDTTKPVVVSKSPVTSAPRTANFVARFSEPVTGVTTTTMRLYVKGRTSPLPASVTLSSNKLVATLNPKSNLISGKIYTLKLTSGIKDRAGNTLIATSWSAKAK